MPLSVTTMRPDGWPQQAERGFQGVSKVCRSRLLMPISRRQSGAPLQLLGVVHFDQHVQPPDAAQAASAPASGIVQGRGDQQDAVGAEGARFDDLVGVDGEILAQHRQLQAARAACR